MRSGFLAVAAVAACVTVVGAGSRQAPATAGDVLARAVKAHGGETAGAWKTLTVRGRVEMQDGITYNAAFLLQAKAPGRVRIEQDMTADRGRITNELFLNGGQAWSRRNLVVNPRGNARQMTRWLAHCYGVGYYVQRGTGTELGPDETVEWKPKPDPAGKVETLSRPAYVVTVKVDGEPVKLHIDKETFHLLQETWFVADGDQLRIEARRLARDFKAFGTVVFPARVLDITVGRDGRETVLPYSYDSVAFDTPIPDWVFEEDRPKDRPVITPGLAACTKQNDDPAGASPAGGAGRTEHPGRGSRPLLSAPRTAGLLRTPDAAPWGRLLGAASASRHPRPDRSEPRRPARAHPTP